MAESTNKPALLDARNRRRSAVLSSAVAIFCLIAACGKKPAASPPSSSKPTDAHVEVPTAVAPLPGSSLEYVKQMRARLDALPSNAGWDARMAAAEAAKEIGDLWRRESLLRSILKERSNDQRARFYLAETLERLMRFREARALYQQLLADNPGRAEPYLGLASTAMEMEGRASAWKWLERGVEECGRDIRSLLPLAGKYREWDDLTAASNVLVKALTLEPSNTPALFQRATVLLQMGKIPEGRVMLEKLLFRETLHPGAHIALATSLLADSNLDLAAARIHAETAASLDPNNPDAHWASAAIYRRMGLLRMAARSYVQALALNPADPQARFGLAQVYGELGMRDHAARQMAAYKEAAARIRARKLEVARLLEAGNRPEVHVDLAREAERIGNYAVAIREAQTAVGLSPSHAGARQFISQLYGRLGWGAPPSGPRE